MSYNNFIKNNNTRSKFNSKNIILSNPLLKPLSNISNISNINEKKPFIKDTIDNDNINSKKLTFNVLLDFIKKNKQILDNPDCKKIDLNVDKLNIVDEINSDHDNNDISSYLDIGNSENIKNLPVNLKTIFKDYIKDMVRYGVLQRVFINKEELNCSLITSILTCLTNDFILKPFNEQTHYVTRTLKKINTIYQSEDLDKKIYKKIGINKTNFLKSIHKLSSNTQVLKTFADFFHINLFVLDLENDLVNCAGGDVFIPYKKSLFLILIKNNYYEPLLFQERKYLTFNSPIIKHLLNYYEFVNFVSYVPDKITNDNTIKKKFQIGEEDLNIYLSTSKEVRLDYKNKLLGRKMGMKFDNNNSSIPENSQLSNNKNNNNDDNNENGEVLELTTEDNNMTDASEESNDFQDYTIENGITDVEIDITKDVSKSMKYTKSILTSKKFNEISLIATQLNIPLKTTDKNGKCKNKTKSLLIDEILSMSK